ncbi:MAG: peptidylprolyl isomerase [Chloroflexi bacterium]|nr:peptidylprolyl isomerase [Chloroflexota bacterium]
MTKKKQEKKQQKKPREISKRQLSRWQKQRKRERLIRFTGISIIIAVVCVIVAGIYITQFKPLYETVIKVNNAKFSMQYFINTYNYFLEQQPGTQPYLMIGQVEREIKQNELIRLAAMELGITVSNDEVDEELEGRDPPLSKDHRDIIRTQLLAEKLLDEYFDPQIPRSAEQVHIQAMFLESEAQALEVTNKLAAGDDFTGIAAELSLDNATKEKKGDLGWHPRDIVSGILNSSVAEDYAFNAEPGVLSQPIYDEDKPKGTGYWLIKIVERKEDSNAVKIAVIQLGSQAEAEEAKARLDAGEDFGDLAAELSKLDEAKEDRGDVGEVTPGMLSKPMDDFIFGPEVELETVSEPIHDENTVTDGGYWLIKVLGKDNDREIDEEDRTLLKGKALNEWVESLWDNPNYTVESFLDNEKVNWALDKARELRG